MELSQHISLFSLGSLGFFYIACSFYFQKPLQKALIILSPIVITKQKSLWLLNEANVHIAATRVVHRPDRNTRFARATRSSIMTTKVQQLHMYKTVLRILNDLHLFLKKQLEISLHLNV